MARRTYCGRCHDCGTRLRRVLDGEEWCDRCETYHRYQSHGWGNSVWGGGELDSAECPDWEAGARADRDAERMLDEIEADFEALLATREADEEALDAAWATM